MESTVCFRSFEEDDAKLIFEWMNDDRLKELSIGVNRRMCHDEALDWVKARMRDRRDQVWWVISPKEMPGKMIGYACITDIHYINRSANFSGIVIGDKNYRDGFAWLETYLFIMDYAFERLNLNRLYGECILEHTQSTAIGGALYWKREGIKRESVYKGGRYYDVSFSSILRSEYFEHKYNGDYAIMSIIRRLKGKNKK